MRQRTLRYMALVFCPLAAVACLGGFLVPKVLRQVRAIHEPKDRVAAENELLRTVLQTAGGMVVIAGLYFTSRTLQLSQQGQITDRFNDAIDHIGADALAVRLGGIHALARIAADSARDAPTIVEILCSFLREATRASAGPTGADVKTILTILGSSDWARETRKDLHGCLLRDLQAEHLDLRKSVLDDADFTGCRLASTRFDQSSLRGANFENAHMRDCVLSHCDVTVANFEGTYLRNASFDGAEVLGAKFTSASLLGASFREATHAIRPQFEDAVTDGTTVLPEFRSVV